MKTRLDWLNLLPEPYRTMAITNATNQGTNSSINCEKMSQAINLSMSWSDTPQGQTFWSDIRDYYDGQERMEDISKAMTECNLDYYNRLERIRNNPFPDAIGELAARILAEEKRKIEAQRQIDERVTYSSSFKTMLSKISESSEIAATLREDEYISNVEANYVTMRGEMCSFLPPGREHKTNEETGKWLRDGRQDMKPAKLAKKLLLDNHKTRFNDADYEKFTNAVKSYISVIGDEEGIGRKIDFKVEKGRNIIACYNEKWYSRLMGTDTNLWGSCMRYESCEDFFGIYTENEDVVSLLVANDIEGKVLGRAILWTLTDGKKAMDTIYSHESLFESFFSWAKDNGYHYKSRQSCHHTEFDMFDGSSVDITPKVKLLKSDFSYYPYMDTLYCLDTYGVLSNDESSNDMYRKLKETGGGYEDIEQDGMIETMNGRMIDDTEAIYLDYRNHNGNSVCGYAHSDDCVECQGRGETWTLTEDAVEVNGDYYRLDSDDIMWLSSRDEWCLCEDTIYCDHDGETIHVDDAKELHNGEWAHEDDCSICAHDGERYLTDDMSRADDGKRVADVNMVEYEEQLKQQTNETITA